MAFFYARGTKDVMVKLQALQREFVWRPKITWSLCGNPLKALGLGGLICCRPSNGMAVGHTTSEGEASSSEDKGGGMITTTGTEAVDPDTVVSGEATADIAHSTALSDTNTATTGHSTAVSAKFANFVIPKDNDEDYENKEYDALDLEAIARNRGWRLFSFFFVVVFVVFSSLIAHHWNPMRGEMIEVLCDVYPISHFSGFIIIGTIARLFD